MNVASVAAAVTAKPDGRRNGSGFSLMIASGTQRAAVWIFAIFVVYSVVRVQEVWPDLNVPKLPKILAALFVPMVMLSVPQDGWLAIWKRSFAFRCMIGVLGLAILTIPVGIYAMGSWNFFTDKFIVQFLTFATGAVLFRDRKNLRRVLAFVLIATSLLAWKALTGQTETIESDAVARVRVAGSLDPNDFGAILVPLIPLALWMGNRGGVRRWFWTAIAFLLFAGIIPTASRGALLGIAAVALVLILQGTSGMRRIFLAGAVAAGALLFSVLVSDAQMGRFTAISGDAYNTEDGDGRMMIWKRGVYWMVKRPWGYGLGNFPIWFGILNGPERAAHNSLVQIGMELGPLALACFLGVYFYTIRDAKRYRRLAIKRARRSDKPAEDEAALSGYLLASLAGLFVTGFFLSNAYSGITMLIFAISCGLLIGRKFGDGPDAAVLPQPIGATGGRHGVQGASRRQAAPTRRVPTPSPRSRRA